MSDQRLKRCSRAVSSGEPVRTPPGKHATNTILAVRDGQVMVRDSSVAGWRIQR